MKKKIKLIVLMIFIVLVLLGIALMAYLPAMIFGPVVGQHIYRDVYEPSDFGVEADELQLITDDGLHIATWLCRAKEPKATIIILSGIENPSVTAFFGYAKFFQKQGYNSLLIEMRAHNASEGEGVAFGTKEWLDVKAGVDYLQTDAECKELPVVVMGTSMGGATAIIAAGEIPEIDAVISISAYSSGADVFADSMTAMGMPSFLGSMEKPFVNLYLGMQCGFDKIGYTPIRAVGKIGNRPILLMHSTEDSQVPYVSFERLTARAEEAGVDMTTFIREGDEHFICYDQYYDDPAEDVEFSNALINFLEGKVRR